METNCHSRLRKDRKKVKCYKSVLMISATMRKRYEGKTAVLHMKSILKKIRYEGKIIELELSIHLT